MLRIRTFFCVLAMTVPVCASGGEEEFNEGVRPQAAGRLPEQLIPHKPSINNEISTGQPPAPRPARRGRKHLPALEPYQEPSDNLSAGETRYSADRSYSVSLNGCTLTDDRVNCSFSIGNDGKVRYFSINSSHEATDNFGNDYKDYSSGRVNGRRSDKIQSATSGYGGVEFKVTPRAQYFTRLQVQVRCDGDQQFIFRNVPLARK
jgi:hypothetical protein